MKKITLFGYGKTTRAIAKRFGPCTFFDDKVTVPQRDEERNLLLPPMLFEPQKSELEVPSPGIPPSNPLIKRAENLISEYDLFLSKEFNRSEKLPYTVWVSGTNGKTTTTQMITHLLKKRGAVSGGNIGTPLAELDQNAPIWVLETSSFTLHYTKYAKPDLYLLLPVTPDHIEWHGSEKEYLDDKLKPLLKMREGEAVILPKSLADAKTNGFKIAYDDPKELAEYFSIDISKVEFEGAFLLDAVLALGVAKILFDEIDYEKINSFELKPHRQEKIYDSKERLWINDSKATNIDATIKALEPYANRRILLILGGDDKGVDLTPLFETLEEYDLKIFAIGANAKKVADLAKSFQIEHSLCETLKVALQEIDKEHTETSVALLSPAAASLDQFTSYAQRGEIFKNIISGF